MAIPTPLDRTTAPTVKPVFATSDFANGPGGQNNVIEPSAGKKDQGWDVAEKPARETMNWIHRFTDQWIDWLESYVLFVDNQAIASNWSINAAQTTGLTLALNPGFIKIQDRNDTEGTSVVTTLVLAASSTNYVFWNASTNLLVDSTTAPPAESNDIVLLYIIVTDGTDILFANAGTIDVRTVNTLNSDFTGTLSRGYVPDPGSEDSNLLQDDGTWTRPYPRQGAAVNVNYTFVLGDNWQTILHTGAGAQNWTVPPNSSVAFPTGATIFLINGAGSGAITILEGAGVDVFSNGDAGAGSQVMPGLGNVAILRKTGTDSWSLEQNTDTAASAPASAPTYGGHVDAAATAERLPSGWTAVRNSAGNYTVTHSLGLANALDLCISATPAAQGGQSQCETDNHTINAFDVFTTVTDVAADREFMFTAVDISGLV